MVRGKFILLLIVFAAFTSEAQVNQYFVFFKDKANTPYSISSPTQFLSERSIARRQKQNIPVIEEDLPVNLSYVIGVKQAGATVFYASRWWNGVLVEGDITSITSINSLSFVSHS